MSSTTRSVALTAGILSLALTLAGCGTTLVSGQASSAEPPITDVAPADFPITGAAETEADVTARNALADLNDFWAQQFPDVYGEDFPALTGGYFSVDPGDVDESLYPGGEIGCSSAPEEVEQNAFYCPPDVGASNEDSISYDRAFLQELADQYGRFLPALIMAHEFGHAVQGRVGYPAGDTSINVETQADCFAGAWTKWVADGNAMHETIRAPELDGLLAGYFIVRDPPGTGTEDSQAHGSYFDRVSAIQDGFDGGAAACRDNYESDRVFTQAEFTDEQEYENNGNLPLDEVPGLIDQSLPIYYDDSFPDDLGTDFVAPTIEPFDGTAPSCAGMNTDTNAGFCPDEDIVYYDQTDLAAPAYEEIGDYAVVTAVAIPYGIAARDQLGLSTDDEDAIRSATCQAGAFSGAALYGEVATEVDGQPVGITLSPGDFDEAVQFLLAYGKDPTVFPDLGISGFQLVDVFRQGFLYGLTACGLQA
ncbi:neutral zinc metallopeptidase [Klenkia terrae]|jgi:predicted metalloprotease|uniref:Neutral zinc metallopeptidase n=2 Tax=Klenkia terrae TaxID=1052259 RepID=A0ABU8E3C1_9ACTN|nr:neutral zinc metallopeptidase [Klenkia terrae]SSC24850.1 Uncharacterised protein family, zinc metallopeptidase putative [Klenkia terrae]